MCRCASMYLGLVFELRVWAGGLQVLLMAFVSLLSVDHGCGRSATAEETEKPRVTFFARRTLNLHGRRCALSSTLQKNPHEPECYTAVLHEKDSLVCRASKWRYDSVVVP